MVSSINKPQYIRDVRGDEGISSFPIARGNWKASSEETRLSHARVMRDFPSRVRNEKMFFLMKSNYLRFIVKYIY